MQALCNALLAYSRPAIFHSDNGVEYNAKAVRAFLTSLSIVISRSKKGCPWENGYQESFYDKFKNDLGDPARFASPGELTAAARIRELYPYTNRISHSLCRLIGNVRRQNPIELRRDIL